jgi:hypothetical protein
MNWYKKAKQEAEKSKDISAYWPRIPLSQSEIDDIDKFIMETNLDKWISVDSSFISYVAYFAPLSIFEVKLKDGNKYSFKGVPKKVFQAFMRSPSKGKFFNRVIRQRYRSKK